MKTISHFFILCIIILLIGCGKNDDPTLQLSGIWIEVSNQSDTIDFDSWDSEDLFELRRGTEMVNGYVLPIHGSSVYRYIIQSDSILIYNTLSSFINYQAYYIRVNQRDDTLQIGNFYDTSLTINQRMTFFRFH